MIICEYDKVMLTTGEMARISEVLEEGVAYVADIFKRGGKISIEHISQDDIYSVFKEVEHPLRERVI